MNATVLSLVLATVFAPPAKTSAERSTRIYVRTTPPGASIVLDGKELGTSDGLFLVPPGVRKITLEMDGFDPETKNFDVKEGWITRVEVQMVKKKGDADTAKPPHSTSVRLSPFQVLPVHFDAKGTPIFDGKPAAMEDIRDKISRLENPECISVQLRFPSGTPFSKCQEIMAEASEWQKDLGLKEVVLAMQSEEDISLAQAEQLLQEYKEELAKKLTRYGENHPEIVRLKASIRATEDRIERLEVETVSKRHLNSPAAVVERFFEAVRIGDDEKAASLFTPAARAQVAQLGYQVAPKASDAATFDVVKVTSTDDHATVVATWTDHGRTDRMAWLVRSGTDGWRISGMEATVLPGEPPLVLDFENLAESMKKIRELRETIQNQSTPPDPGMPEEAEASTDRDDLSSMNEERSLPLGFRKRMAEVRNSQLQKAKEAAVKKLDARFEDEFELAVRAGRGKLTDQEKESLKPNHPLLGQLADPNTSKLIRFFAKLPDEIHEQLKKEGHVKWRFPDLSEQNQKVVRDIIRLNINMAKLQGTSQPGLSLEALQDSQVGFAVVSVESASQKVVSWFVLFPEFPNPIWVTVVNARAAGTPPYFQAHLRDLPLLREKPKTALPDETRAEARKIHLPDADTKDTPVVLDLASGEMLMPPPSHGDGAMEHFTKLGKGDIGVDHGLFCLRGGKIQEMKDGAFRPREDDGRSGDATLYRLPALPCELLVTTAEKRQYVVMVLAETEGRGLELEYREHRGGTGSLKATMPGYGTNALNTLDAEARSKYVKVKAQLEMLGEAVEKYREDMGSSVHALFGLTKPPADPKLNVAHLDRWAGPYLKTEDGHLPKDPWGSSFWYSTDADRYGFQICSPGPDGDHGTVDDIVFPGSGREPSPNKAPHGREASSVDEGVLEFRVAANEEEAKALSEDGANLGWYDSVMDSNNSLVTREQGRRSQVLLWQTPEKSMTASDNGKNKWSVIQVSVIAEPNKPGCIGVVFDAEGGRQLKKLTAENTMRRLAMLVDGCVVSCPTVRSAIGPRVEITGDFSKAELNRLATALQAGMEPSRP